MFEVSPVVVVLMVLIGLLTVAVVLLASRGEAETGAAFGDGVISPEVAEQLRQTETAEPLRRQLVEAELRTLRAQISPHFIYNSLNAIAATIPMDPARARELVIEFADFTRYSLRAEGAFSTVADELAAIERYVLLEKVRFGEQIEVGFEVAPEALPVRIPFLSVQPLVENAVQHGAGSVQRAARVRLTAYDQHTHVAIAVEDDGPGADPEHVEEVLAGGAGGAHMGLRNVDLRLRQAYGGQSGLVIETAPGEGMRASMRIPKSVPEEGL